MAPAPKFSPEEQQKLILEAAVDCITETSVTDFGMAKVAKLAGLSMGSVYKFFQCKEDIVLALAHESFKQKSALFETVLNMPFTTPEKMIAVSLLSPKVLQHFPFDYELESYATNEAVVRRASAQWNNQIIEASKQCQNTFVTALTKGIASGELSTTEDTSTLAEELTISGWAMTVGYEQVLRVQQMPQIIDGSATLLDSLRLDDPMIHSMVRLINSYPWVTPLTEASLQKIDALLVKYNLR